MKHSQSLSLPERQPLSLFQIVVATSAGNALEWFDIAIYGFFAVYIGKHFFPTANPSASLLLTFGTFGASYLVRPIGGIVLGAYADRRGRKAALMMSVGLMMLGTAIVALIPAYETIGLAAPLGVFAARLIQGFSAGGEFGASTAMLIEHAPHRRGFLASWQFATQGLSILMAAMFGFALARLLPHAALDAWGWRVPFFFGLLIGPLGLYLRRFLEDAPDFTEAARTETPVRDVFATQKRMVLAAAGALAISTSVNYLLQYVPTYAIRELHLPASTSFAATIVGGVILTCVTPLAGYLSDRIGRLIQMTTVAVLFVVTAYPAFSYTVDHLSKLTLFALVAWLALLKAIYFGALPALMSEMFPAATRSTGMSVAYNIGVTVFGGFTPAVVTWLISATANRSAPSFYVMVTAMISLAALASVSRVQRVKTDRPAVA
ncbi:MFS transporter [Trinickia dabaoshanensis]|uniref:MFS transporter n=1 Tax=Trinickia dabaoshanensis TaxID=564714 RepID=A0A2N7VMV0_9BURK|nr:MFS transporter [Trinickia dabaoshanensis]